MDSGKNAQYNLTIMQQIGELKNWHKQQQKIIQQPKFEPSNGENQSLLLADPKNEEVPPDMDKKQCQATFENPILETQKTMQWDIIALKNETKEKDNVHFDELPIHITNTDFNKLVENSIKTSKFYKTPSLQTVKHKFLKKGEGTARFGMILPKPGKKCSVNDKKCSVNDIKIASVTKPQNDDENIDNIKYITDMSCTKRDTANKNCFENHKNSIDSPKTPEQIKSDGTLWKSVLKSSSQLPNSNDEIQVNVSVDSVMLSFIEKILSLDEANKKECEELKIFELLEQRVLDSSFSSNSSVLTRLMENSVKSTPVKRKLSSDIISGDTECVGNLSRHHKSTINANVCTSPLDSSFDFISNGKIKKQTVEPCNSLVSDSNENEREEVSELYSNKLTSNNNGIVEKSLHVHFAENDSYKSLEHDKYYGSQECIEMQEYATQLKRQNSVSFDDCEEWSCGDCTCENNTEYSSSEEDCRAISPPSPVPHSSHKADGANRKTSCDNMLKVEERCKDSDYGLYYVTNSNAANEKVHTGLYTDELKTVDTDIKADDVVRRSVIEARLKELETEIETFRLENNKLKKLRSEYDQEYKKFQNEKNEFFKHLNEEKNKIAATLEIEKRKLAKEKQVFEKYSKTVSKNPSKQERAEILSLKQKLTELQEEMNKKESRWGASQARVRNQMRQLEEDNKRLKDEIEQIKKMSTCNQHISGNYQIQENPISNTQLIHIINKQLSNLGFLPEFEKNSLYLSKQIKKLTGRKTVGQNKKTKELKKVSEAFTNLNVCDGSKLTGSDTGIYSEEENDPIKKTIYTETIEQVCESENSVLSDDNNVLTGKSCKHATEMCGFLEHVCEENEQLTINSEAVKEIIIPDGKELIKELIFPDGRKEIYYPNGNIKKIGPGGDVTKIIYFNGDVKETCEDGTVKYYYAESKVWHTTYLDGLEVLDYPNGLVEQRYKNGTVKVIYPNGSKKCTYPDNTEEWIYPDGSTMKVNLNNDKILTLPNGQKEIHTKEHMRREYPDGTIKFVYPDGTQETRYSNGRIRLKDKSGNLVMDSG